MEIKINCEAKDYLDLNELMVIQGNLKDLSTENYNRLKADIEKNGFISPFHVWRNDNKNKILDGTQRLRTVSKMREDGYTVPKLPVVYIDAPNEKAAKEMILSLTSQYGNMTDQGLYEFISDIDLKIEDLDAFRFPDIDIDKFDASFGPEKTGLTDDDEVPDVPEEAITKEGDLIILGNHRLLCGDSTVKENIDKLMDGQKADMVFTDPPYGLGGYGGRNNMELKGDDQDPNQFYKAIPLLKEVYVWGRVENWANINFKPRDVIVWKKNNFGLGRGYRGQYEVCFYKGEFSGSDSDVWEINKDTKYEHPTQKPVALAARAIKNSKPTNVLDIFGGSGSTLIACEKTDRKCFMMELDPTYVDVIINRYINYVGEKSKVEVWRDGCKTPWAELRKK